MLEFLKRILAGRTFLRRTPRVTGRLLAVGSMLFFGVTLGLACGEQEEDLVDITTAEWTAADGGSPRIVVGGKWPRGVSTPPRCQVFEGRDGEVSRRFVPDTRTSLDNNTFSKRFVPTSPLDRLTTDYYVRCSATIDPGTTLSDKEPVSGSIPPAPG